VHAVRARPLQNVKNNIEPDEQREEADTIPTRGVTPETRLAPGSRPSLCPSVGLVVNANASTPRACFFLFSCQGLTPLPIGCRPYGLYYSPPLSLRSRLNLTVALRRNNLT